MSSLRSTPTRCWTGRTHWSSSLGGELFHANPKKGKIQKVRMMESLETPNLRKRSDKELKGPDLSSMLVLKYFCSGWLVFKV